MSPQAKAAISLLALAILMGTCAALDVGGSDQDAAAPAAPAPAREQSELLSPEPRKIAHVKASSDHEPKDEAEPECLNSFDPECGKFSWKTDPGPNERLGVEVAISPSDPKVGDRIRLELHALDPDAPIDQVSVEFDIPKIGTAYRCRARFGQWDPPKRERGEFRGRYEHVFTEPGWYSIDVWVVSGAWECNDPYGDASIERYPICVSDPDHGPSPEPSASEDESLPSALREVVCVDRRGGCPLDPVGVLSALA